MVERLVRKQQGFTHLLPFSEFILLKKVHTKPNMIEATAFLPHDYEALAKAGFRICSLKQCRIA